VGLVVSVIAVRRITRGDLLGRASAVFGVVCGATLTVSLLALAWLGSSLDLFGGNAAQHEVRSLVASVRHAGGRKLCDNGDAGRGIDNRQPWYEAYYEIADRPGLTDEVKAEAAHAGYPLEQDTERISELKDASEASQFTFDPEADYLVGTKNGNRLQVTIDRDTAVPLYCGVAGYGTRRQTGADDAIVSISMELPDR
jgi:hypothetical protein